ncbi:MAG: hypothetical protein ACTSX6_14330 [Candidatus Heimdallarchaeaceae archaeon]
MNKRKTLFLALFVSSLLTLTAFTAVHTYSYNWDIYSSQVLQETNNVGYGLILNKNLPENQYLQLDYASDVRYVKEGYNNHVDSYGNDSTTLRGVFPGIGSSYYTQNSLFDYYTNEWKDFPTYIQANNLTGVGSHLNFTSGVNSLGVLSLTSKTALVLDAKMLYFFSVKLKAGELYDLNIKSTSTVNFYIYYNNMLSYYDSVNGYTRDFQPLAARDSGIHLIYLYSSTDNDVVINPKKIEVTDIGSNTAVSRNFVNEPNQIWNETRQANQENKKKETVHAYYVTVPKGTYQFKYSLFDSISSTAWIIPLMTISDNTMKPVFMDIPLDSFSNKFTMHFEKEYSAIIFITAEYDNTDYIEFEYIFSVKDVELPIFESGNEHQVQDDIVVFGFIVEQTEIVYFNKSTAGLLDLSVIRYLDSGDIYFSTYTVYPAAEDTTKILLQPGFYFLSNQVISSYDFILEVNTVTYEEYTNPTTFSIKQQDGTPVNYKLFKLNYTGFKYTNYNFTLLTQNNYTVDVEYELFGPVHEFSLTQHDFVLGKQQVAGIYEGYRYSDSQEIVLCSQEEINFRYLLVYIKDIYNNTGYSWPNKGDILVNQTSVQLRIKNDPGYPDVFENINVHEIDLDSGGTGVITKSFTNTTNDKDLYIIRANVLEYSWYKVKVLIVNGTIDAVPYFYPNRDLSHPSYFYAVQVVNKYYYKDMLTTNYFAHYDSSNISHVTYDIEFGIYNPSLIFFFGIDHAGLNGTIRFDFIKYNCTPIPEIILESFFAKGLGTGAIIGLAIAGSIIVVGTVAVVVVKVILPKRR